MSGVEPGTPCWVDLATPDLADAKRFYRQLFGWTERVSRQPQADGYITFLLDGRAVAGAGPSAATEIPVWSTYVATDDADLAASRVRAAGGQVVVAPFDVFDQGRMGVFADPAGATFSVWQPRAMRGAEVFNVPGSLTWSELVTPDPEGAHRFYELVFGWHLVNGPTGPVSYPAWRCGARIVAGVTPLREGLPAQLSAYWSVFFAVADADAVATLAAQLGGTILVPPGDFPQGRLATLRDPSGALFSILAPAT
ncbi:VOC family protein [Micromonospora sp. KC721]|uniref:VOC family protein n=1 Tax=Micromonospora sp. KC721 TaxID=2530380 RepID=UPI00104526FB|nr:VOC family protein [Micromonospora sp. KC721]TDB82186.1 VOC family protein [Micromonospora sp. KC721]